MSGGGEKAKKFFRRIIMSLLLDWAFYFAVLALLELVTGILINIGGSYLPERYERYVDRQARMFARLGGIFLVPAGILGTVYFITVPATTLNTLLAIPFTLASLFVANWGFWTPIVIKSTRDE